MSTDWHDDLKDLSEVLHEKIHEAYRKASSKGKKAVAIDLGLILPFGEQRKFDIVLLAAREHSSSMSRQKIPAFVDTEHFRYGYYSKDTVFPSPHLVIGWETKEQELALRHYIEHHGEASPYSTIADKERDARYGLGVLESLEKLNNERLARGEPPMPGLPEAAAELRPKLLKDLEEG